MTDRELLELAAKAAGYAGVEWKKGLGYVGIGKNGRANGLFDPLRRDGDAFRLMVRLGIGVKVEGNSPPELGLPRNCAIAAIRSEYFAEEIGADIMEAARRAIVRAAAALGEQA